MLMQMVSCIMMSRVVFDFLDMHYLISIARRMHILGAYWGFLFIGIHAGLHWHMCVTYWKKKNTIIPSYIVTLLACIVACYGVFSLIKRQFLTYLFLRSEFVFMNYQEPVIFFYFDYVMILGLCIFIGYYGMKLLRQTKRV